MNKPSLYRIATGTLLGAGLAYLVAETTLPADPTKDFNPSSIVPFQDLNGDGYTEILDIDRSELYLSQVDKNENGAEVSSYRRATRDEESKLYLWIYGGKEGDDLPLFN